MVDQDNGTGRNPMTYPPKGRSRQRQTISKFESSQIVQNNINIHDMGERVKVRDCGRVIR